ncbi:pilus assembly protein CpaF [Agromyces ramosus]|uniref:Pilus assembly protein CpaF n=1 Tax=Agromyces ramosus TaxID=33879 RepID=A0A4Q7MK86_9MICO|nr:TadA family conjugal transfer-associated ATPase [Agromyces ramosus]RZS68033.1 pilus assembly protein CpaF [Agromyces ramosus]
MTTPFVATPSWEREARAPARRIVADRSAPHVADRAGAGGVHPWPPAPARSGGVAPHDPSSPPGDAVDLPASGAATADLALLGPLAPFAASGPVTDLFVNGDRGLWIDRGAGPERETAWSADEVEVRALAVQLIARGGRHIDEATPAVDVRLGRGIRVHAVLPPVSSDGTLISIRVPRAAGFPLAALARTGMVDAAQEEVLREAVAGRRNLLVTGAGGTGKTTLLAALLGEAPGRERLVIIEDVAELTVDHPHVVSLEARQANLEGAGHVGLDALLREALRMRPDRLVVGECRGVELRELLAALNTGHDGGAGTLHANSLDDVPARLEALGATAGLSTEAVARQTVSAFDLVLHLDRVDGRRRLAGIGRFELRAERLAVVPL